MTTTNQTNDWAGSITVGGGVPAPPRPPQKVEKLTALFEVKSLDGDDPNGEFEAILSMPTLDRDGEVIDARAFEPLPDVIPIHKFHDFWAPVAHATPYYDGDVLKAKGSFDPDPASQEIRSKVGRSIRFMSVGFMAAERSDVDGVPHITKGELLEASFVSIPSNREAAILAVKDARDHEIEATVRARLAVIEEKLDRLLATKSVEAADTTAEKTAAPAAVSPPLVPAAMARLAAMRAEAEMLLID